MPAETQMGTIILEVPEKLLRKFGETPGIRSRAVLEALAIECYRTRKLFNPQCAMLLGMTGLEFQQFRRERGVPSNVPVEMVVRGYRALRKIAKK